MNNSKLVQQYVKLKHIKCDISQFEIEIVTQNIILNVKGQKLKQPQKG